MFLALIFAAPVMNAQETAEKTKTKQKKKRKNKYKLPDIDLSHWKVTIPAGDPAEVEPPEILDYATNETLKKYMYNDSVRGTLVFYAEPAATTANTKYSRSELREQIEPGNNNVNWTFKEGGKMKGRLVMGNVSQAKDGKYHKVMIMQIHGRLTNEQRDLIGQKDNNAPPILKIYWDNGKVRVKTKQLKDLSMSDTEILKTGSWKDDKGFNFDEKVDFRPFTLEVKVSEGKLVVGLNNSQYKVYDDIHIEKWGVFENYFKAGNYFQTRDEGAFAEVKYFELEVSH
ncbi:polysaccharide lyase family 7 protein [Lutimonas sp.]|uniref:polysaccharide lyase family 7 protein n=1 Tax=Lutimonas sp. TaxID=1872403 RepID=UPI003D9B2399